MMSTTEGELDVDLANEREEGELDDSDVEEGTYIPLQRPDTFNPPSLVNMQIQDEQSDEASPHESSGSDSDDEPRRHAKRTKIRPKRPQPPPQNDKKNKYNIWCKTLQEELLTEDMISCDVNKRREYGVESYDYTIKYRLDDNYVSQNVFKNRSNSRKDMFTNKRKQSDRGNVKLRLGKRVNSNYEGDEKQEPNVLEDLKALVDDPIEDIAKDIAEKLNEEKVELITRITEVLGANKAIEMFKETQRIEMEGGMLVMNGTRRRTPGGIYFFLLKRDDDVSQEMVSKIFSEDRKVTARRIKRVKVKSRQKVMEQLKQSLTDSELPSLLSRGEAMTAGTEHGSNPPPSPVTDAKDCSSDTDAQSNPDIHLYQHDPCPESDGGGGAQPSGQQTSTNNPADPRQIAGYEDDDFLEVMCNDEMDMF